MWRFSCGDEPSSLTSFGGVSPSNSDNHLSIEVNDFFMRGHKSHKNLQPTEVYIEISYESLCARGKQNKNS